MSCLADDGDNPPARKLATFTNLGFLPGDASSTANAVSSTVRWSRGPAYRLQAASLSLDCPAEDGRAGFSARRKLRQRDGYIGRWIGGRWQRQQWQRTAEPNRAFSLDDRHRDHPLGCRARLLSVYRERSVRRWTDGDGNVPDVQQRGVSLDRKHRRCWSRTFWRRKQSDEQCIGNLRGRARCRGGRPPAVDWRRTVGRRRRFRHPWTTAW